MERRVRTAICVTTALAAVVTLTRCGSEKPRRDIVGTETKLYSQGNEELVIRDFFQDARDGFFLDVGCAWPIRNSTTFYLEKHLGWSGIAVDALENYGAAWARERPGSKFVSYAVADRSGEKVTFYKNTWPGVSSLSKEQAGTYGGGEKSLWPIEVETITLTDLLDAHGVTKIDHLTLDIEGAEAAALAGFDIERFAPELVCVEGGEAHVDYFESHGYELIEAYVQHDRVNRYFRRVGASPE